MGLWGPKNVGSGTFKMLCHPPPPPIGCMMCAYTVVYTMEHIWYTDDQTYDKQTEWRNMNICYVKNIRKKTEKNSLNHNFLAGSRLEVSGWLQSVPARNAYQTCRHRYGPFLRHVTSNKTYDFPNSPIFNDGSQNWYTHWLDLNSTSCKTCIDKNNITHVYIATKYPHYKA